MSDRKQVSTILCKQAKMINKRLKCSTTTSKKMLKCNKITISLQKDYNYNQIDGYFAWPTSFINVCNLIWKMIWGSDCHVTISYRDVKIIILNFILFKYICILIYKQYQNNEKNVMMKFSWGPSTGWKVMPFCLCPPNVMFLTREYKNSLILSLILFPTGIVVSDINLWSTKVIQWVPWRHKMLTHGHACLFRNVTYVSIHSLAEWLDTFAYVLRPQTW